MPTTSLIDFDALDLTRVMHSHADVYALLKQSGSFALLDGVLHFEPAGKLVVGYKDIRADDWWCAAHIPGRPIFPGALMIEAGAQLCSFDYMMRTKLGPESFLGFGGLDATRFRGIVEPGVRMVFAGEVQRIRSRMFTYLVHGFVERQLVFETEVIGVVV